MTTTNALKLVNITKSFSGNKVLREVNLEVRVGEVHALIGANGAGKSTLMKVLNGIYTSYEGDIVLHDKKVKFNSPFDAQKMGIAMIHQELDLVTNLSAAENLYLGRELMGGALKGVDRKQMYREAQTLFDDLGFDMRADALVETLSTAQQQLLLVAKAVAMNAEIIVMDEPTSSLSNVETERLFATIRDLQQRGKSIIYISHYLEEIFAVCDRVTVLRDGESITTLNVSDCTQDLLVSHMLGKEAVEFKKFFRTKHYDDMLVEAEHFSDAAGKVNDVSFTIRRGEILGLAGVVGSGRTELAELIFGAKKKSAGELRFGGKAVNISGPTQSVKMGMAFISENRKEEGLITGRSIADNISIIYYDHCLAGRFIRYSKAKTKVDEMIKFMSVVCRSAEQEVNSLSGGNQQKAILGRWISVSPKLLILDQPTRGIDVGARAEIYELINALAEEGTSILLISDELDELIHLSDQIVVLKKGAVAKVYPNETRDVEKDQLLSSMVG